MLTVPPEAEAKYPFAYGNFCGPNYPPAVADCRSCELLRRWPPVDELDAMCYAHDQCYASKGMSNVTCDDAFHSMLIKAQSELEAPGCWHLTTDMTIAFFFKYWGRGSDSNETWSHRLVQFSLGIPVAAFWAILKLPIRPFLRFPEEGRCGAAGSAKACEVIRNFERQYETALFAGPSPRLEVPKRCDEPMSASLAEANHEVRSSQGPGTKESPAP